MTRTRVFLSTILILIASVPWFFSEGSEDHYLGLPVWALYSLVVTFVYAVTVALILQRYWPMLAGDTEDGEDA
jgi:hypothetical protein